MFRNISRVRRIFPLLHQQAVEPGYSIGKLLKNYRGGICCMARGSSRLEGDHGLVDQLPFVEELFALFLDSLYGQE